MSKSHEIVIEVLNKMTKERMNTREKYNRKLRKLDIKPSFLCYRTSELYYILSNDPLIKGNKEAERLVGECFSFCTRDIFRFIHLDDLKCLIRHHDAYNKWPVDLI